MIRDRRTDASAARRFAVRPGVIALVAERGARRDVGADIEERLEAAAVAFLAAGQMESDRQAVEVGLEMDFRREPAARAAKRLVLLPPFAPAAET